MSTTGLRNQISQLLAGTAPTPPTNDPYVLTSTYNQGLGAKAGLSDLLGLAQTTLNAVDGKVDVNGDGSQLTGVVHSVAGVSKAALSLDDIGALAKTGDASGARARPTYSSAVLRPLSDLVNDVLSVKDFGAVGDGGSHPLSASFITLSAAQAVYPTAVALTDELDQVAFEAAIAAVNTGKAATGKIIRVPVGTYKMTRTLTFPTAEADGVASITLQGDGQHNTIFDFSRAAAGSNGIAISSKAGVNLRDLKVLGAPQDNIYVFQSKHTEISNVRSQGAGRDGVRITDCYMVALSNVYSLANSGNGFTFGVVGGGGSASGYNTSIQGRTLYAQNNTVDGFVFNNTAYSSFSGTGADGNRYGYNFTNAAGISLSGVGAESNYFEGFYIASSASASSGALVPGIKGLTVASPFAFNNSTGATSGNNFAFVASYDTVPVQVTFIGATDLQPPSGVTRSLTVVNQWTKVVEINSALLGTTTYSGGAIQSHVP